MDLLSLVAQTTKRKGEFISEAEDLAKRAKTEDKLEKRMSKESKVLVKSLRDGVIRWEEYARALAQKTLVSALAAVYLGAGKSDPRKRMEEAWPIIIGDILTPLVKFLAETKGRLDSGALKIGDKTLDFADPFGDKDVPEDFPEELLEEDIEDYETEAEEEEVGNNKKGKTWLGLFGRVERYLSTPVYSFMALGVFLARRAQGYTEMQRIAKRDKKICEDCKEYAKLGWQPIGSLPLPGRRCRCYDRCRCQVQYR